jgi:oligopeptide transport system permease protein
MLAGYTRGWAQAALLRGIDLLYALPHLLIVIVLMALCGNNTLSLCISIGLLSWLNMARIVYGQVRYLRSKAYLEAAQALGQSHLGIIFKHLLPNLYHLIIVCATLTVPGVILMESTLSFLGLGLRAPQSSLGEMIRQGCTLMEIYPSALLAPCLVLSTLLVTLTVVGESIESRWRMALEGK